MIDKIERQLPALGIAGRADETSRLKQHDVIVSTRLLNPPPVHLDVVRLRIDEAGKSLHHPTVHADRPLLDESLAGAARGNPRFGENSLNSDFGIGFGLLSGVWCRHSDHSTEVTVFERITEPGLALDPRCRTPLRCSIPSAMLWNGSDSP